MLYNKLLKLTNGFRKPSVRCLSKCHQIDNTDQTLIRQTLDRNRQPTKNEWHELRKKLMLNATSKCSSSIDATIMRSCLPGQLDIGKSYWKYLQESGEKPNSGALLLLLELYYRASKTGTEISGNDQQDIIEMYENLRKEFPVFDSTSGEGVIYGLVLTIDWRKSVEILDSIKMLTKPSSAVYSAVIQRAIQEKDEPLVWHLLNDMATKCEDFQNEVFISYIGSCEKNPSTFTENIDRMLTFIGDNRIVISTEVVNEFQRTFHKFNYNCSISAISKQGKCQACRKRLGNIEVTVDEFNDLSNHFFDKIFIEENIFSKSTPQELDSFVTFIDKTRPFDCVIDGLNVALLNQTSNSTVQSLVGVVKHFVSQKKRVLVIGRKHMTSWPKAHLDYIRENAKLFLTENSSQDDLFFLYSTLKSGPNTDFVTNDIMRDHTLTWDKNLKIIFRRWQEQHQYKVRAINDHGRITLAEPVKFDMNAQQVDGCWHIPFENGLHCTLKENYLRKNWLCVSERRS